MTATTSPPATGTATATEPTPVRYLEPDWVSRHIANRFMTALVRIGIGVRGGCELQVKGRVSGEWRSVPVNPLDLDGHRYLVAPRGRTEWVRNLRTAGGGRLRKGRRVESFTAVEVPDEAKTPVLRLYLERWAFEVGRFFEGITAESSDEELAAVAAGFPVFEIR